jgi:hypothetical protein
VVCAARQILLQSQACHTSAYVSIRQHTSAYVSIRQHTPNPPSISGLAGVLASVFVLL